MMAELFLNGTFMWICVWQSTAILLLGLCIVCYKKRYRPSRLHQLLLITIIAAVVVPALSLVIKNLELGFFVEDVSKSSGRLIEREVLIDDPLSSSTEKLDPIP